jgi:hypothetical protein
MRHPTPAQQPDSPAVANRSRFLSRYTKVQQLERQLDWNSSGPLGEAASASVDSALSITGQIVTSLRQAAVDQPLTTLFLSFQAGYAVGRCGHRHESR